MALVSSGDLNLASNLFGPTRCIRYEILGGYGTYNLLTAFTAAGFPPGSMADFYGYSHASIPDPPFKVGALMNFVVRATWFDGSDNETGFRIQWSINGGAYGNTHTVGAGNVQAIFPGTCQNGSTYKPRVQSYNDAGASSYITGGQTTGNNDCPF